MDFSKKPENENPHKNANFISQLFLLWTMPLLWKGMKNGLTTNDLTKCLERDKSNALADNLERAWKREIETACKTKRKPRLWRALFHVHSTGLFGLGLCRFVDIHLRTLLPLILAQLLIQFQEPTAPEIHTNITTVLKSNDNSSLNTDNIIDVPGFVHYMWNDAFGLATLLVLTIFSTIMIIHHGVLGLGYMSTRMRIACCSLMYRKSIRLSASAASQTGIGHVVNLMSNDVSRLERALLFGNSIWILPIQSVVVGYLIWQRARWVGVIGVTFLLLKTVPVQTYLGHYRSSLRKKIARRTDKRIGIMNEIVQGIQVIKMYTWEIPFQAVVAEARRLEIQKIRISSYVGSICGSSCYFVGRSTLFISIVVLYFTEQKFTADIVFAMGQYYHILQLNAAILYPMALACGAEALVSLQRIEDFLLKVEKTDVEIGVKRHNSVISCGNNENVVELNEVTANWRDDSCTKQLSQINLKISPGKICAVVGPVGSGKSSLIQLLLGELPVRSGEIIINGSISYAAQEPWIFSGTVRNNILFGESYDRKRYNKVVKCCALLTDFDQLPYGDKTFVGDRGASLSGGQRARISLARAMYKMASIYLLDDPLSAVDAHVGKHLFDEVIGPKSQIAKDAIKILITHQVHLLKEADVIVIIENGRITHRGTYTDLSAMDIDFAKLLEEGGQKENKPEMLDDEMLTETGQVYEDERNENEIDNMSNSSSYTPLNLRTDSFSKSSTASQEFNNAQINEEEQIKDSSTWRTFFDYFSAGSSHYQLVFLILIIISTQFVVGANDYFLKYFTYQESQRDKGVEGLLTQVEYLYIYGALIVLLILICTFRSILFYSACIRSSESLHDKMFSGILHTPMRFFDENPAGRILNRISSDMGLIDEVLPPNIVDAVGNMINMGGILILIIIVNPTMITFLSLAIVSFGLIIKLYVRASQDLKRLEGICRSPIFSHLTATLNGLTTIRTRNINQKLCCEFDGLQDVHSSVLQLSMTSTETFGLLMDIVSTIFLACVTYSFILFNANSFSGNVGLAICQALMLTGMVQFGVRRLTDAMQQMTNVERIIQYAELEAEYSPHNTPPNDWPSSGSVQFHNLSLRYDFEGEATLKNISFEIPNGSKIGVVGRTGAGKSSLIAALFRLTHVEGLIEIDGIDTNTISLASLRSKISIIPQNPVLFSGTLRRNLDPFDEYCDDDIWKALDNIQMIDVVEGLNMPVKTNGANFSVGQRQLLCLARAILRKNRILVLDEATANVDPQTDQLIQQAIREKFADCTVLTVAHRLNTIIDSDRVLVMDAGKCVEFDTPFNLLSIEKGIFKGMVKALGDVEYNRLYTISSCETAN